MTKRSTTALILVLHAFIATIAFQSQAQIQVTQATGGLNVCTGIIVNLSNIDLNASNTSDFAIANNREIVFQLPTGFAFATIPTLTGVSGNINIDSQVTITSATAFKVQYDVTSSVAVGQGFTVSNIQVIASAATFGIITRPTLSANNDAVLNGSVGVNYGLLSSIVSPSSAAVVGNQTVCGNNILYFTPNSVVGVNYNFYDMSNNLVAMFASTYTKNYASGVTESFQVAPVSGLCQGAASLWATVTGVSVALPPTSVPANSASELVVCEGTGTNPTLSVTGGTVFKWYADQNLTSLLSTSQGGYTPSPAIVTSLGGANYDYYVVNTSGNCNSASTKVTVSVQDVPSVAITNLSSSYCANSSAALLTAFPILNGGNSAFVINKLSGPGSITNALSVSGNNYYLLPSSITALNSAVATNIRVVYTVTINGCVSSASGITNVYALPSVDFTLPASPTLGSIRDSDPPFSLLGSPAGGSFSGSGVAGNTFDVRLVNTGVYNVSYTASLNGCTSNISKTISVVTNSGFLNNLLDSYCQSQAPILINVNQSAFPQVLAIGDFELLSISGQGISGNNGNGVDNFSYTFTAADVTALDGAYYIKITARKYRTQARIRDNGSCFFGSAPIDREVTLPYLNPNASFCDSSNGGCGTIYNYGTLTYTCGTTQPYWETQNYNQLIRVKSTPVQPTISNLTTVSNCIDNTTSPTVYQNYSVTANNGATVRWWGNSTTPILGGSGEIANGINKKITDLGISTTTPNTTTIKLTQEVNGCISLYNTIPITVKSRPTFPQLVSPVSSVGAMVNYGICLNQPTPTLSVTSSNVGTIFNWYVIFNSTGFRLSGSEFTPSFSDFNSQSVRNQAFNVSQVVDGCESATPLQINLDVKPLPIAPIVSNDPNKVEIYCKNTIIDRPITITGAFSSNFINLYNFQLNSLIGSNIPLNGASKAIIDGNLISLSGINTKTLGNSYLYFTQIQNGCESEKRAYSSFFVSDYPAAPNSVTNANNLNPYCNGDAIVSLVASGSQNRFTFYDENQNTILQGPSTITSYLPQSPQIISGHTMLGVMARNYYVSNTNIFGCESTKFSALVRVNPAVPAPTGYAAGTSAIVNYCQGDQITAAGVNVLPGPSYDAEWYSSATLGGGNLLKNGVNYSPAINSNIVQSNTYYAIQTLNGCKGTSSLPVTINVFSTPGTAFISRTFYNTCVGFDFANITIVANNPLIRWYSDALLTQLVFSSTGLNASPNADLGIINSSATGLTANRYFTQTSSKNCESNARNVRFNVFDNPPTPIANDPFPYCYRQSLDQLNAGGSPGALFTWYDGSDNSILSTITSSISPAALALSSTLTGTTVVKVRQTLNGCISLTSTSINFVVHPPTPAPTVTSNFIDYCTGDDKKAISPVGDNLKWYLNLNDLPLLPSAPIGTPNQITQNYLPPISTSVPAGASYFVTQTLNGCEGNKIIGEYQDINVSVFQRPNTPTIGINTYSICNGSSIAAITPNISNPAYFIKWYAFDPLSTVTSPIFTGLTATPTNDLSINNTLVGVNLRFVSQTDNSNGCESKPALKLTFNVASIDTVKILTAFNKLDTLCRDTLQNPISLFGSPSGGKFSMDNRDIVSLKASEFSAGQHTLFYAYTNKNSQCTVFDSVQIRIMPVPVVNFSISSLCAVKDTIQLTSTSILNGNDNYIDKLKWSFGSSFRSLTPDTVANPRVIYSSAAAYPIALQATTKYPSKLSFNKGGCVATSKKPLIYIGNYPNTNFTSRNICAGDSTFFNNTSIAISDNIKSWQWNFGDGDIVTISSTGAGSFGSSKSYGSFAAIRHKYASPGVYIQSLTINTDNNCDSSYSKRSFIVPKVSLAPGTTYYEDFENGTGGFVASEANSSWQFGTPAKRHINGAASGSNAWVTSLTGSYKKSDATYVQCPCFDLSNLKQPVVSMKFKSVLPVNIDGVVLQATDSDVNSWVNVGNVVDARAESGGLNWYNVGGIQSNPGNQVLGQFGWSMADSTDNKYKEAKFKLDILKDLNGRVLNKATLRFRMAFASTANGNKTEGFAFDDFSITERDRKILLEQFTNTSESRSVFSDKNSNAFVNANPYDILAIHYHTASSPDEFNKLNYADPSARALYYGVDRAPFTVLNGNKFKGESSYIKQTQIDTLVLAPADFVITPSMQTSGTSVTVNVQVMAKKALARDAVLNVVVVEREISVNNSGNGQTKLEWVMRKMLPDAGGTLLTAPLAKDATLSYSFAADLGKIYDINKLGVVVSLQDKLNKEIYQSASFGNLVYGNSTSNANALLSANTISLFPNPASKDVYIGLSATSAESALIEFYNVQGVKLKSVIFEMNKSLSAVDIADLPSGMYVVKLLDSHGNMIGIHKLVIE